MYCVNMTVCDLSQRALRGKGSCCHFPILLGSIHYSLCDDPTICCWKRTLPNIEQIKTAFRARPVANNRVHIKCSLQNVIVLNVQCSCFNRTSLSCTKAMLNKSSRAWNRTRVLCLRATDANPYTTPKLMSLQFHHI